MGAESPGLEDLAARVLQIVQALAASPDKAADALKDLVPTDLDERVASAADQLAASARDLQASAEKAAQDARARADEEIAGATETSARTVAELTRARDDAVRRSDAAIAAAEAAFEQATAMGNKAMAAATQTRDAALAAAERTKAAAEQALEEGTAAAQQALTTLTDTAEKAVTDAVAAAEKAVEQAKAAAEGAVADARRMIDDAAGAAAGLPDQLVGLGDNALERLDKALTWPSGILSLVAKLLIWLKREYFRDVAQLQVVWQAADPGPLGIGLVWTDGPSSLRIVYRPAATAGAGDTVLIRSAGAQEHSISAPGIAIAISAKADQDIVIGKGSPPTDIGPGGVSMTATFPAMRFDRDLGPLKAVVEAATIRASIRHAGSWSYEVSVDLPKYGGSVRPAELFAQAGLPIPIAIPSIDEYRSLTIGISDGTSILREGAISA